MIKRLALFIFLAGCLVPFASAQDREHVQLGVFADYFRWAQTSSNLGGVGALAGFQAFKQVKLEAQMSYDFTQTFTEGSPTTPQARLPPPAPTSAFSTANSALK
jgi:hypothetical protein